MLLSYKPLHLEAQQRLQEEGCVVDIRNHSVHHPFLTWDNALENDDRHTSIYLQLNDYNSILEQSMTLYECLRRCTGIAMNQE